MLSRMPVKFTTTANAGRWFILVPFALVLLDAGSKMFTDPDPTWRILHGTMVAVMTLTLSGTEFVGHDAVIANPNLRLEKHVIAADSRLPHPFSDLTLVEVRRGCVDESIAVRKRRFDRGDRLLRRILKDAETDRRDLNTVVQREKGAHFLHRISLPPGEAAS
jgi:hypothetical protein